MTERDFLLTRAKLLNFFETMSTVEGILINRVVRDDRTTLLLERVYEEEAPHRHFNVCLAKHDSYPDIDAFCKKIGPDYDIDLLVVFTSSDDRRFGIIWQAYVKWIHHNAECKTVLELLNEKRQ